MMVNVCSNKGNIGLIFLKKVITGAMHHQLSKLDALYQRHAGQECYIFGDGISLKWMDLQQFSNRLSIAGNMIVYHNDFKQLRAPYCTITEPFFFYPVFPYRPKGKIKLLRHYMYKEYKKSIAENPETTFFINFSNYPVCRFPNILYISRLYKTPFEINNPFRDRTDSHGGTFSFQLSLAIFLGFKKAYLVGHDYTHFPSRSLHFYEKGEGILDGNRNFKCDFINYAKQYIDLTTVTLEGGSETMNAITYKELTGKEPQYRENTSIVDRVKLENLATWHGYSIF